jgi:hypothetical protein
MQILSNSSQYTHRLTFSWKSILLSGFFLWTLILSLATVQVQHSCSPMLHWSNTPLPEYCPKPSPPKSIASKPVNLHVPPTSSLSPSTPTTPQHFDGLAKTVGVTVGIVAAILEAPLIMAVGAGAFAWFMVRTFS